MESDGWKLVQVGEEKHFMKGLGRFSRDGWHRRLLLGQPGPCAPARPKNPRYSGRPARATCCLRRARLFTTAIVQWVEGYAIIDVLLLHEDSVVAVHRLYCSHDFINQPYGSPAAASRDCGGELLAHPRQRRRCSNSSSTVAAAQGSTRLKHVIGP